jgi:phosphatidylserine/phosphatidylglycerophosphate/cardiolipin synthase-like enzyme
MKRSAVYCAVFCLVFLPFHLAASDVLLNNTTVKVYFSPDGGALKAITRHIDQAVREILVLSYVMTSKPVETALMNAHRRGVQVEVIFDKDDQKERKYATAKLFKARGIAVWLDDRHACSHNKVMIIDRGTVITGSFNFTYAAEKRNAENLLIIPSADLAGLYTDNFLAHRQHSRKY